MFFTEAWGILVDPLFLITFALSQHTPLPIQIKG
jgi:hypothetical protein